MLGNPAFLNQLLGFDRAIVMNALAPRATPSRSDQRPRHPLRIVDTAGIRESEDQIEREGIERTSARARQRRSRITRGRCQGQPEDFTLPTASPPGADDPEQNGPRAHLRDKTDGIRISCNTGKGIDELRAKIFDQVSYGCGSWDGGGVAINARHRDCLARATEYLRHAAEQLRAAEMPELVAVCCARRWMPWVKCRADRFR